MKISLFFLVVLIATLGVQAEDAAKLDSFAPGQTWKFNAVNGKGSFELGSEGETPIGILNFDFTQNPSGQRYVIASKDVDAASGAQLTLRVRVSEPRALAVRLVDSTGQTLQYTRVVKKMGEWETLTFSLTGKAEHWGGANDGTVHFPIAKLSLIAQAGKDATAGKVEFADLAVGGKGL